MALSHSHDKSLSRTFAGMRLLRVAAESVVYHCERCKAGVRLPRCATLTQAGIRCRLPARSLYATCAVHAQKAVKS